MELIFRPFPLATGADEWPSSSVHIELLTRATSLTDFLLNARRTRRNRRAMRPSGRLEWDRAIAAVVTAATRPEDFDRRLTRRSVPPLHPCGLVCNITSPPGLPQGKMARSRLLRSRQRVPETLYR